LHPLVPLCSCLTRRLLQLTSSGMLWKSMDFSITPAKITPVHVPIWTEVAMLQCQHGREVDKPHAYHMLTESKPLCNQWCCQPWSLCIINILIIGSGFRTHANNMHRRKGLIVHEKSKLTYNFNCLITCHIWGCSLFELSCILCGWLRVWLCKH